jgi:hypothetical protein
MFGALYEGLNITFKSSILYNVMFMLRRLIFAVAAVTCDGWPLI